MNIRVLKTAKMPLKICNGSEKIRHEKAETILSNIVNEIRDSYKGRDIELKSIKRIYKKNITERKNINIKEPDAKVIFSGYNGILQGFKSKAGNLSGYNIFIPVNKYSKKFDIKETNTLTHELWHSLSNLFNPKYAARRLKIEEDFFYKNRVYSTKNRNFKNNCQKYLENKLPQEKINLLQCWRYLAKDEIKAYQIGSKYEKLIKKTIPDLNWIPAERINPKKYKFEEKVKTIEKILSETIQNERKLHTQSLKTK